MMQRPMPGSTLLNLVTLFQPYTSIPPLFEQVSMTIWLNLRDQFIWPGDHLPFNSLCSCAASARWQSHYGGGGPTGSTEKCTPHSSREMRQVLWCWRFRLACTTGRRWLSQGLWRLQQSGLAPTHIKQIMVSHLQVSNLVWSNLIFDLVQFDLVQFDLV